MKHLQHWSSLTVAAAITAGMLAGFAADGSEAAPAPAIGTVTRSVTVRYDDLDLTREAGARALYARLNAAAKRVCGSSELRDLQSQRAWRQCYSAALGDAVGRSGNARVAALHEEAAGGKLRKPAPPRTAARQ
jgi:UrcA family protein